MKNIVEEGREKEDMMEREDRRLKRRKEENTKGEGRFEQKR